MIFGTLTVDYPKGLLETHGTSFPLDMLFIPAVDRPFLPIALLFGAGLSATGTAFFDVLYAHEIAVGICVLTAALFVGFGVGKLSLRSRELRSGDQISDAVWGTYFDLNMRRRDIAHAGVSIRTRADTWGDTQ